MSGLVIGLGKPKDEDESDEIDHDEARNAAAQDMMDAIKADNASKFAAALQDFILLGPADLDGAEG
jgi:hypothetical protein